MAGQDLCGCQQVARLAALLQVEAGCSPVEQPQEGHQVSTPGVWAGQYTLRTQGVEGAQKQKSLLREGRWPQFSTAKAGGGALAVTQKRRSSAEVVEQPGEEG